MKDTETPKKISNLRKIFTSKNYSKKVPLGRMAKSEEIANVVTFLASDAASYMNGSSVIVDGGWTSV